MSKKEENLEFFNAWASWYDSWLNPFRFWLKHVQKKVSENVGEGKVIDIGCGTGDLLLILDEKSKKQNRKTELYGIDISKKMLEKSKRKLDGNALIGYGNVESMPFNENYFDFVCSTEAFHHYENPKKAVSEMHRILKKGGEADTLRSARMILKDWQKGSIV